MKYDRNVIERYVICGFLKKKGNLAKLTLSKHRWFFLMSSVPVSGESDEPNTMEVPAFLKMDTIFFFTYDSKGDATNFVGKIVIDDCDKPELMSADKN